MKEPNQKNRNKENVERHHFDLLNHEVIPFILIHFNHQAGHKRQDFL